MWAYGDGPMVMFTPIEDRLGGSGAFPQFETPTTSFLDQRAQTSVFDQLGETLRSLRQIGAEHRLSQTAKPQANTNPLSGAAGRLPAGQMGGIDPSSPDRFLQTAAPYALHVAAETGLPAHILLAIAANETSYGNPQFTHGNNYMGIKGPGTGPLRTWEVRNGQAVGENASFRAYESPLESFRDFARVLQTTDGGRRYGPALQIWQQTRDPAQFIRAVNQAGYATDPAWADKIINIANRAHSVTQTPQANPSQRTPTLPGMSRGGQQWSIAFGFAEPYGSAQWAGGPSHHRGVDLVVPGARDNGRGLPFTATTSGQVISAGDMGGASGNGVIIWGDDGLYHRYFHADGVSVRTGQYVNEGDTLGIIGDTGSIGFPHLHYEVSRRANGDPINELIDPRPYIGLGGTGFSAAGSGYAGQSAPAPVSTQQRAAQPTVRFVGGLPVR